MDRETLNNIEKQGLPDFKFQNGTLGAIISNAIPIIYFFAGMALLIYLILGGISLMTSGGDPKKVAGAKSTLTNAGIGFFVIFISYWIVQIIGKMLGLDTTILSVFS